MEKRELYTSPNGDRSSLCDDPDTGNVFIKHQANIPSGGQLSDLAIGAFLSRGELHPERHALLELIGTLASISPAAKGRKPDRRTPPGRPAERGGVPNPLR